MDVKGYCMKAATPNVYVSVEGTEGQLVVSGPMTLLVALLAAFRPVPTGCIPQRGGACPPVGKEEGVKDGRAV